MMTDKFSLLSRNSLKTIGLVSLEQLTASLVLVLISTVKKDIINGAVNNSQQLFENVFFIYLPAIFISGFVLFPIFARWAGRQKFRLERDNNMKIFSHILNLEAKDLMDDHSGSYVSQLTNDLETYQNFYTDVVGNFLYMALSGIGGFIVMLLIDWRITLIMVTLSLISVFFSSVVKKKLKKISDGIQTELSNTTQNLVDIVRAVPLQKVFPGVKRFTDKYREAQEKLADHSIKKGWINCNFMFLYSLINTTRTLIILILGLFIFQIDFGSIVALMFLASLVQWLITDISTNIIKIQSCLAARDRILKTLKKPFRHEAVKTLEEIEDDTPVIEIENLSFAYGDKQALDDINISIAKNQFIGIVGPIGSGKSTIIKLLLGLYQPVRGQLKIQGQNIADFRGKALFNQISYVDQQATLFDGSIYDNISCWRDDVTIEEVRAAAQDAYIDEFINSLPDGYQTDIGQMGNNLSGGQRQRIAIARALLKDAPILIMDEATSALDNESEREINQVIEDIRSEKTIIIIAHRLATIERADKVYVLQDGRLVEKGRVAQLLQQDGLYKALYDSQYTKTQSEAEEYVV